MILSQSIINLLKKKIVESCNNNFFAVLCLKLTSFFFHYSSKYGIKTLKLLHHWWRVTSCVQLFKLVFFFIFLYTSVGGIDDEFDLLSSRSRSPQTTATSGVDLLGAGKGAIAHTLGVLHILLWSSL